MAFFELQGLRLEGVRAFFQALLAVFRSRTFGGLLLDLLSGAQNANPRGRGAEKAREEPEQLGFMARV